MVPNVEAESKKMKRQGPVYQGTLTVYWEVLIFILSKMEDGIVFEF